MDSDSLRTASNYWNSVKSDGMRRRYWEFPTCIGLINRRMGTMDSTWGAGCRQELKKLLCGSRLKSAISIGCGAGTKELLFVKEGLVEHFDLFEISEVRIEQGKKLFEKAGLSRSATFRTEDGIETLSRKAGAYDLVYWDHALHHMPDTFLALQLSKQALRPGGFLILNDYVGPNRFQWPDAQIDFVNRFRSALPDRLFDRRAGARLTVSRTVQRPTVEAMIALDPSEAPDSAAIMPALKSLFPDASIWRLGGVIYHLGLNDVLANFRIPEDEDLLALAMFLDETATDFGYNHFTSCIWKFKP